MEARGMSFRMHTIDLDDLRAEYYRRAIPWDGNNGSLVNGCLCCPREMTARQLADSTVEVDCACGMTLEDFSSALSRRPEVCREPSAEDIVTRGPRLRARKADINRVRPFRWGWQ